MNYSEKLKDPRWQKKRLQVLERDEYSCMDCGDSTRTLHVHHISYSDNPWDTDMNRLVTLCESCHEIEEDSLKKHKHTLFNELRARGFTSVSFGMMPQIFDKDRGWSKYEPAFDVLKMVVDDDDLWYAMEQLFFNRLMKIRG